MSKIIRVELRNFKKHEALDIATEGKSLFLLGPNEAGKSSILDAVWFALNPAKETADTRIPEPLKQGAKKGHVKIVIGADGEQYTVTRTMTAGSDERKITITKADGLTTTKVDMLEKVIGYRHINPFEFVDWGKTADGRRKQLALIESILPAEIREKLAKIKDDIETLQSKASMVNTEKQALEKAMQSLGVDDEDLKQYAEAIDVSAQTQRLVAAQKNNAEVDQLCRDCAEAEKVAKKTQAEIEDLERQLEAKRAALQLAQTQVADFERQKFLAERIDEEEIKSVLNEAQAHNAKHTLVSQWKQNREKLLLATGKHNEAKAKIEARQVERKEAIASAKLPIPGLSFDEEQIYLNDLPLSSKQLSTSQIMKLAFALAIAMGGNDKLNLLCISRGESLDNNSIEQLRTFLKEHTEYQVFIEQVDRNEKELKVEYLETE